MIWYIIIAVIFYGLFKFLNSPYIYIQDIDKNICDKLYFLLFYGKIKGDVSKKGMLSVETIDNTLEIYISKYKIKGKYGLYIYMPIFKEIDNFKNKIEKKLNNIKIDYFFEKSYKQELTTEVIVIDLKQDVQSGNYLYKDIFSELFEYEKKVYLEFYNIDTKLELTTEFETILKNNPDINLNFYLKNYIWILSNIKKIFKK